MGTVKKFRNLKYKDIQTLFLITLIGMVLLLPLAAQGKSKKAKKKKADSGVETLDITNLQEQYWKPKEQDFRVIQNKLYTKKGRIEFGPVFGVYARTEFENSLTPGFQLGYHFDDTLGLTSTFYKFNNSQTNTIDAVENRHNISVAYNSEQRYMDLALEWTPIYGKFSLLGKKVSHLETYIAPMVGVITTKSTYTSPDGDNPEPTNSFLTYGVGIGERFFLSKNFLFKFEYQVNWYKDNKVWQRNDAQGVPAYRTDKIFDNNIVFSITYLWDLFGNEAKEREDLKRRQQ